MHVRPSITDMEQIDANKSVARTPPVLSIQVKEVARIEVRLINDCVM